MPKEKNIIPLLMVSVFFISFSTLLFELSVIRLFSVLLWYHFVFIIVSISILGLGIGALLLFKTSLKLRADRYGTKELALYAFILAAAIPLSVLAILFSPFPDFLFGYIAALLIPFIAAGIFLSAVFYLYGKESQRLYFADLIGGGLGSLAVLPLQSTLGAINTALLVAVIPGTISLLIFLAAAEKRKALRSAGLVAVIAVFALLSINGDFIENRFLEGYGSTKTLFSLVAEEEHEIVYTEWSTFARTDVVNSTDDSSVKYIFTDGGATSEMIRFDGNLQSIEYLKNDISYFPFTWGNADSVLIIGSGGGKDILLSLLGGASEITAVEINRSIINAARNFSDYNGHIYDRDDVRVEIQDGRHFVETTQNKFDLLYLPLVYTQSAGRVGYALTENYVFTMEAFEVYMERLNPEGRLAFVLHDMTDLSRAMVMIYQLFLDQGLSPLEAVQRMVVAHTPSPMGDYAPSFPVLVVRNEPFTAFEIDEIYNNSLNMGMTPFYLPGHFEPLFINSLVTGENTVATLQTEFPFDIKPSTDNSPFFYNTDLGLPQSLSTLLLVVSIVAGIALIYLLTRRRSLPGKKRNKPKPWWPVVIFPALGIGFMLVEITLIQKMILVFGNPTLAFSILLFILLISSGLGSYWASRITPSRLPVVISFAAATVALGGIIYAVTLGSVVSSLFAQSLPATIILVLLITTPMGLAMGIPFSSSLRLLREIDRKDIPLAWGINGVMSVMGSALAVAIAMQFGFSAAFTVGALFYMVVAVVSYTSRSENLAVESRKQG
ncbi:MAG: hypothetical protein SCJ97_11440 [Bacillota bacterium]|nr:hypothetical protein [Bacillota bacterium]